MASLSLGLYRDKITFYSEEKKGRQQEKEEHETQRQLEKVGRKIY